MATTDTEEIFLKRRVAFWEATFISYKKMLGDFHANHLKFHSHAVDWEWFRTILTEGRNESKMMLAQCQDELEYYRQGINPPFLYNKHKKKTHGI